MSSPDEKNNPINPQETISTDEDKPKEIALLIQLKALYSSWKANSPTHGPSVKDLEHMFSLPSLDELAYLQATGKIEDDIEKWHVERSAVENLRINGVISTYTILTTIDPITNEESRLSIGCDQNQSTHEWLRIHLSETKGGLSALLAQQTGGRELFWCTIVFFPEVQQYRIAMAQADEDIIGNSFTYLGEKVKSPEDISLNMFAQQAIQHFELNRQRLLTEGIRRGLNDATIAERVKEIEDVIAVFKQYPGLTYEEVLEILHQLDESKSRK